MVVMMMMCKRQQNKEKLCKNSFPGGQSPYWCLLVGILILPYFLLLQKQQGNIRVFDVQYIWWPPAADFYCSLYEKKQTRFNLKITKRVLTNVTHFLLLKYIVQRGCHLSSVCWLFIEELKIGTYCSLMVTNDNQTLVYSYCDRQKPLKNVLTKV